MACSLLERLEADALRFGTLLTQALPLVGFVFLVVAVEEVPGPQLGKYRLTRRQGLVRPSRA